MTRVRFDRAFVIVALLLVSFGPALAQQGSPASPLEVGQTLNQVVRPVGGQLQGFSIVLVLGDLQGGSTPDNIPAGARAALADLKDFLPYKGYRLLDTSWILGSTTQLFRATSRLRGVDDQTYEVSLTSSPVNVPPSLQMKFVMRDGDDVSIRGLTPDHPDAIQSERRRAQLKAEMVQMSAARAALEKEIQSVDPSEPADERRHRQAAARDKIRDLDRASAAIQSELQASSAGQTLIDTSFNMRVGETVVVGTSRVRGDKALIALLTAVRK